MDRFHIVVSNYKRLSGFVDNFHKIRNFNPQRDRVFILDCSPEGEWHNELETARRMVDYGLTWGKNVIFVRRRNWAQNFGAVLDYYQWLLKGYIRPVSYNFFMQEHYLDTERSVNVDTIPDNCTIDLDAVEQLFYSDMEIGCAFMSRLGVRVGVSMPGVSDLPALGLEGREDTPFKDTDGAYLYQLAPGGVRRAFFTDGGNYIARPEPFLDYFRKYPDRLVEGNGGFGFCVVWELRLGQILCDLGLKWVDLYHGVNFRNLDELDAIEARLGRKISSYWYQNMNWIYYYGYDLFPEEAKRWVNTFQPITE